MNPQDAMLSEAFGMEDCPATRALRMVSDKWKLSIVIELARRGALRTAELRRALHGVSQKVLTESLRGLEFDNLVSRTVFDENPPHVEYALTERGRSLVPILSELQNWEIGTP